MTQFEIIQIYFMKLSFYLNLVTIIILTITLYIYYKQLKSLKKQLYAMKVGEKSKNLFEIVKFLQENDVRESRDYVINKLITKKIEDYVDEDNEHASRVCSSYGTVGGLFESKIDLDKHMIFEGYGQSIVKCHTILQKYIEKKRKEAGESYWKNFDNLYNKTIENYPSLQKLVDDINNPQN